MKSKTKKVIAREILIFSITILSIGVIFLTIFIIYKNDFDTSHKEALQVKKLTQEQIDHLINKYSINVFNELKLSPWKSEYRKRHHIQPTISEKKGVLAKYYKSKYPRYADYEYYMYLFASIIFLFVYPIRIGFYSIRRAIKTLREE
ncbi:MAG: hypothetical protein QY331_09070 [Melioribacteraceae bacterium]|nr:MAG: hypothetical protein QY331_09070 [Melioribacteraceae bacterium]